MFRSVSSLHKNGAYHGNLKPSNLFFIDENESLSSTVFIGEAGFVSTKRNSYLYLILLMNLVIVFQIVCTYICYKKQRN